MSNPIVEIRVSAALSLYHRGPPLDLGPLPSLFYFALSGPDSLGLDPYNQPVLFLQTGLLRVFSLTLPAHESPLSPKEAIGVWAEEYQKGKEPLGDFLDQCQQAIDFVIAQGFVDPDRMAIAGLSRGGFIALHLAVREPLFTHILGFAPVTDLLVLKEFKGQQIPSWLDLHRHLDLLSHRHIRFYIGNHDTRVDTQKAFSLSWQLANVAVHSKIRSPQIEYIMVPSIGRDGHGTSLLTFQQGAEWICAALTKKG